MYPLAAQAQQQQSVGIRRLGLLMNLAPDDPESPVRVAALLKGLQEFGWIDGRNLKIDYRWPESNGMNSRRLIRSPRQR